MKIHLPQGNGIELPEGATAAECAAAIGRSLAKAALAARVNGRLRDLAAPLHEGDAVEIVTFDSPGGKSVFWHSSSHILAQAVQELFPDAKLAIGPAIEEGFYYDFDVPAPFTPEELARIEKRCMEIASRSLPIRRMEYDRAQAAAFLRDKGETYKLEMLEQDITGTPSFYATGEEWRDMCAGPHVPNTSCIKAIKLLKVAGAYWRGSEKNKMLQRVYGISFPGRSRLDQYLAFLEEARKRDHRRLGKELDLFSFHAEGSGFPFWHPNGMVLYNAIMERCRAEHLKAGYRELKTPIVLNEELWHRSGHWDKYRENMYFTAIDDMPHAVKPMNCPGHLLVYNSAMHSYREFPVKYFEFGLVHRHEKAGVLHGLFRVRQFTQDDAHIFCLPDQIEEQIAEVFRFVVDMYALFGFTEYHVELSTRPENHIGSVEIWDASENALERALKSVGADFRVNAGDGAFYGPKIDFHIRDCLNRSWQCGTIQLDFSMPQRFGLEYTDSDGTKKTPVMIHRALLGSMERFIGILIEHYGGNLPLWLSPVQLTVIPVSDRFLDTARQVAGRCAREGLRTECDERSEKIGYKIRDAEMKKRPYMAVIGEKERSGGTISLRKHGRGDLGAVPLEQGIAMLLEELAENRRIPQP